MKQEGVPTIFFTLSMAEYHWPDFLSLLNSSGEDSSQVRKLIQDNPHLVDWYLTQRTEKFVKQVGFTNTSTHPGTGTCLNMLLVDPFIVMDLPS